MTYRIQRARAGSGVVFASSGEIDGAHAAQLRRMLAAEPHGPVRLDLADVTLVTLEGIAFLSAAESEGVVLVNCPDYVRRWIAEHDARRTNDQ